MVCNHAVKLQRRRQSTCKAFALPHFIGRKSNAFTNKIRICGGILAGSFGFASATTQAAGVAAAVPAVQLTQQPSVMEALPEKAHHRPYRHYHHYHHYHYHYHHHHYHHHYHYY